MHASFRHVSLQRFLRFGLSGALSYAVTIGVTWFTRAVIGMPAEAAFAIALATVFVMNFLVMRHFVYQAIEDGLAQQFAQYAVAAVGFRVAEYVAYLVLYRLLAIPYLAAATVVLVVSFIAKFLFYGGRVFVTRSPT